MTQTPAAYEFEYHTRAAAEQHAAAYREQVPGLLENMPASPGTEADVHSALDLLAAALEETARASVKDAPHSPAGLYGAGLLGYALALRVFLWETEPENARRAAVYFITYALSYREQAAEQNTDAARWLAELDAGTIDPQTAHRALSSFPDLPTLTVFLSAHHAFSLAVEALADPNDFRPREALAESLGAMRSEVQSATITGRASA